MRQSLIPSYEVSRFGGHALADRETACTTHGGFFIHLV
jgi:hypothetical protein